MEVPEIDCFVVDEDNLELVYTLKELEKFVCKLHLEHKADQTF